MNRFQVTSVSAKGQVVIPSSIRQSMGISDGTKLIVFTDGDNLLFKPIQIPHIDAFKALIRESEKIIKKTKFKKVDLEKVIKKVRNENRS